MGVGWGWGRWVVCGVVRKWWGWGRVGWVGGDGIGWVGGDGM